MTSQFQVLTSSFALRPILIQADYESTLSYCLTGKIALSICQDPKFWEQKAFEKLGVSSQEFNQSTLPANERYLQLATILDADLAAESLRYIYLAEFIRRAVMRARYDLLAKLPQTDSVRNIILEHASEFHDDYLLNKYLSSDDDYFSVALGAIKGRQWNLSNEIINSQHNQKKWDWEKLAIEAFKTGNSVIFNQINKLATTPDEGWITGPQDLENIALRYGYLDVFENLRLLAPPDARWNWNGLARNSLQGGHKEIFYYIISLVPDDYDLNWNNIVGGAVSYGNVGLFNEIITFVSDHYHWNFDWRHFAAIALRTGHTALFEHIYATLPYEYWNWNNLAMAALIGEVSESFRAIRSIGRELFNYIRSLAPKEYKYKWGMLANTTVEIDNVSLFNYIRSLAPKEYNWKWNLLAMAALKRHNTDFFEYVYALAPKDYNWNWNLLAQTVLRNRDYQKLFDKFMTTENVNLDWNSLLRDLIHYGRVEKFKYIFSLVPPEYNLDWNMLRQEVESLPNNRKLMLKEIIDTAQSQRAP